ncbi:MAG: HAD-IA family hydrolase, partial [Chloracidobacterium sp.]
ADLDARGWSHTNRPLVDWAARVRAAGFKTAILSNMQRSLRQRLHNLCPWLPPVDAAVFSSDVGMVKPESGIYDRVLEALGVRPEQALFIDDVEANTAAARQLGMVALRFTELRELARSIAAFPKLPQLDVS